MDSMQALHQFWSGFGLKAYDESTVPDGAMAVNNGKYLTYTVSEAYFDETDALYASLWYKSTSWSEISQKAEEIGQAIGYGGKLVPFDGGVIWIKRGSPWAQRMSDEDDTIRRIYLIIEAEYLRI